MEAIVRTHGLTKTYQDFKAVDDVNLSIHPGDIYGFLGQNGAGKTTTIRMMMNLIRPSSGSVELFGEKVTHNSRIYERIGSIIEIPGFYPNLTVAENLEMHRRLVGYPNKDGVERALELTGMYDVRNRVAKKLSLGMKQRLGLARALLHQPELLILDEPTNGLDPVGIKEIRQLLIDLAQKHRLTVLISSHILSEVEQLATRVGILHKGKLLEEVAMNELQEKNRHYIEARVTDERKALLLLEETLGLREYRLIEPGVVRIYERLGEAATINRAWVQGGVDVEEIRLVRATLEDYFVGLTGGSFHV